MTGVEPTLREELNRVIAEVRSYYDELEGESPRAAAVLAVAALEDELDALLRSKFPRETSDKKWGKIAGPASPLGSLKAKADFAEIFGFFGSETRLLIDRVGTVRNKFAHRPHVRDFDDPTVLKICREIADNPVYRHHYVANPNAKDVRWNYLTTVKELTSRLASARTHIPELDGAFVPLT